jgi:hypothetical protein
MSFFSRISRDTPNKTMTKSSVSLVCWSGAINGKLLEAVFVFDQSAQAAGVLFALISVILFKK